MGGWEWAISEILFGIGDCEKFSLKDGEKNLIGFGNSLSGFDQFWI